MNDLASRQNMAATMIRSGADRLASRSSFTVYYGWIVVAASAIGLFFGAFPIVVFSFGVFYPAFVRDFLTCKAAVALAFTLQNHFPAVLGGNERCIWPWLRPQC
jgi:hypothetical protein